MTASDRAAAAPKPGQLAPDWLDAHVPEGYTVAAVGDIILTRPIYEQLRRQSPELLAILQQADLVVGNFESTVLDMQRFEGHPSAESGFGWLNSPPEVATDLRRQGFDMMARANNHSTDWGAAGLHMTDELLIAAGLACAGTGPNLSAARAPAMSTDRRRAARWCPGPRPSSATRRPSTRRESTPAAPAPARSGRHRSRWSRRRNSRR
ncbi:CapA family protein [Variovorax ureilyticus]|uniref:CapA family protein n=1 Tax=Variovorax ureilyticus TaxID=1836198 RepID=UPI003D67C81B